MSVTQLSGSTLTKSEAILVQFSFDLNRANQNLKESFISSFISDGRTWKTEIEAKLLPTSMMIDLRTSLEDQN